MGGEGSGRKPSEETIVKRMTPEQTPVGDGMFIPNYSGIQAAALKTSKPLGTGTSAGGGHTIQDEGVSETQRTNLNFSGSAVHVTDSAAGDATIVHIDAVGGASDHSALSNLDYATAGHTGFASEALNTSLSGSYFTHAADSTDPHGVTLTQTQIISSGTISGSAIHLTGALTAVGEISGSAFRGDGSFLTGVTGSGTIVYEGLYSTSTNSGSNQFVSFLGTTGSSVEDYIRHRVTQAGNFSKAWLYVSANTITNTSLLTLRDDGASGSTQISVGGGLTGEFSDDTNATTIAANSLCNWKITTGAGGGAIFTRGTSIDFTPS